MKVLYACQHVSIKWRRNHVYGHPPHTKNESCRKRAHVGGGGEGSPKPVKRNRDGASVEPVTVIGNKEDALCACS